MNYDIEWFEGGYHLFDGHTHFEPSPMPCAQCGRVTQHITIYTVLINRLEEATDEMTNETYQVVRCQGCQSLSFKRTLFSSVDCEDDPETGKPILKEWFYPARLPGVHEIEGTLDLPGGVRRVYRETLAALINDQPVLAGVGLKALIEAVCKEQDAEGRRLDEKIDALETGSILTKKQAEVLHGTRILGNRAAHEVTAHSVDELKAALSVVEHLLNEVYILHKKGGRLPRRKPKDKDG